MKDIPGLEIAGNAYHGIGVPDCIREGMNAANAVVQTLTATAAQAR
jgi:oxygen-dependent protoporphyrinogen oxidase